MNDKIKELKAQATTIVGVEHCRAFDREELDVEKFAELIVRECLDHIDTMERIAHASNASIPDDYDEYTYLQTLNVLKSLIKSQFGVEE